MNLQIKETAGDLRVEILGRFAGTAVEEVSKLWKMILQEKGRRNFTVDVTNMNGYDRIGCTLLRDMYKHGVHIAAASAASLVFFAEISATFRPRPSLVQNKPQPVKSPSIKAQALPRLVVGE